MTERWRNIWTGLLFITTGAAFAVGSAYYVMGSTVSVGPGLFPRALSLVLTALGALIFLTAFRRERGASEFDRSGRGIWPAVPLILIAIPAFTALLFGIPVIGLPPLGLVPAIIAVTFISSLAGSEYRTRSTLVLAVVLASICYLIFIRLLNLPLPVWPDVSLLGSWR